MPKHVILVHTFAIRMSDTTTDAACRREKYNKKPAHHVV
jgi:hypothetical protein